MAFWCSQRMREEIEKQGLLDPFFPEHVKHGAYELAVGPEVFVSSSTLDHKKTLSLGDQIVIPPGQFALLLTEEVVRVPPNAIAFISIRAGIKFRGLINVSGFHVDPGWRGRLKFAVYNAGTKNVVLARGERVFPIWFSDLDQETDDPYDGDHVNQVSITSKDVMDLQGEVASPASLKESLDKLRSEYDKRISAAEHSVGLWRTVTISLLVGLLVGVVTWVLRGHT